jgi:hypothetical protein
MMPETDPAMTPSPDSQPDVRRVVLPSGKTIEVVYFAEEPGAEARPTAPARPEGLELHICPACASDLVYPRAWQEAGDAAWELSLRCPDCEWSDEGVFPQDIVERLDEELDRGTQIVARDLKALMQANMEAEIESFIAALHCDHIWPIDF